MNDRVIRQIGSLFRLIFYREQSAKEGFFPLFVLFANCIEENINLMISLLP